MAKRGIARMNANGIDFKTCYLSDSGVFIKNKGCFVFQELERFAFWLVVDVGEFVSGKESAQLVVDQLVADLAENAGLSRNYIRKCLNKAHSLLINGGNGMSLKASLVLVVTDYSEIIWAVSGNSRLYLIRDRQLAFRSRDQSVAQSLVESDIIDEDGMTNVADRDILTNYLGIEFGFAPFISNRFKLRDGDVLLLCSLGFWEQLRNEAFNQLLKTVSEPTELLPVLKEQFLDRDALALNNYIVGLVAAKRVFNKKQHDGSWFDWKRRLDQIKFGQIKLDRIKFGQIKLDQKQAAIILAIMLGVVGIIITGVMTKMKIQKEHQLKAVQTLTQQNTIADYEKKGDQLVKEGKYAEATAQYDQALSILNTSADKKKEATLRLKNSIILMLKDGDDFLAQQHYQNALKRYEAAQNFDTPNYFRIQIENRITNVRQFLNRPSVHFSKPVVANSPVRTFGDEQNNPDHRFKPKPDLTALSRAQGKESNGDQAPTTKGTGKHKIVTIKESVKPKVAHDQPSKSIATINESNKTISKQLATIKTIKSKNTIKSNSLGKAQLKPTATVTADHSKLSQAVVLVKKGDKLLLERKFRGAVHCYKKAKIIYQKLGMITKTEQLDEKIKSIKKKMRLSFEGAH
jgi:serine/threonine protein phosphatase PrpC